MNFNALNKTKKNLSTVAVRMVFDTFLAAHRLDGAKREGKGENN